VCAECETQYDTPEDALQVKNAGAYDVSVDGVTSDPEDQEVELAGWVPFVK